MNCDSKATEVTAKKILSTEHCIDFKLSRAEESIISNKNIKLRRNEENEKKRVSPTDLWSSISLISDTGSLK